MIHGLQPGPMLFIEHSDIAWTIIASFYIGNVILLILNLPLVGLWARLALIPYRYLGPFILAVCVIGAYSVRNTLFDVWIMLLFGIIGYVMKFRDWPVPPMILGFILGPLFEIYLRRTLQMSSGTLTILFTRPIAMGFLVLTVVLLIISRKLYTATPEQYRDEKS
jgi:putative tricarboxylic transport membrane protein